MRDEAARGAEAARLVYYLTRACRQPSDIMTHEAFICPLHMQEAIYAGVI